MIDTLGVPLIGTKVRKTTVYVPRSCEDCAGPKRRHRRIKCEIYLTEKEWNTFRDAQVRAFGVNADAQKRITNAFSASSCLRETAMLSVIPTLLAMPRTSRQVGCFGKIPECFGVEVHEFKCWVAQWEWVDTTKDVKQDKAPTEEVKPKVVPAVKFPPKVVEDTPPPFLGYGCDLCSCSFTDLKALDCHRTYTHRCTPVSEQPLAKPVPAAPMVKLIAVDTKTTSGSLATEEPKKTTAPLIVEKMRTDSVCSTPKSDKSLAESECWKKLDEFVVGAQKGDDYKVSLSSICDQYSELLTNDNKLKCVTTDSKVATSKHAKIVYRGNTSMLNAELGKKAPFADVGADSVYFTDCDGAASIGPFFNPAIVWDKKAPGSINTTITNRTERTYEFKALSKTARRYIKASDAMLRLWFTEDNIKEADAEFVPINNKPRSWSDNRFNQTVINLEKDHKIMGLEWLQKAEVIFKQGKAGRCIQNEGPERCMRNLRTMFIIEYIIFHKIAGEFNIKHDDKRVVLDRLCKKLAARKYKVGAKGIVAAKPSHMCLLGIDQSAFDFCETAGGLLNAEIAIITKIIQVVRPDTMKEWEMEMLEERKHLQMHGAFALKDEDSILRILVEAHRTRASGDRGTSILNWIVEFLSTIACIFEFPEDIISDMVAGTLNSRWYKTLFLDAVKQKIIFSSFDGSFEGDDGLVQLVLDMLDFVEAIETNFHELGLKCTLETSSKEVKTVVEFVGCHLLVGHHGYTYYGDFYGGAFCPCINKALMKSAWTLSKETIADVASSSYWSRMLQFVGKQDWVAGYFRQMHDSWGGEVIQELMDAFAGTCAESSSSPLPDNMQKELLDLSCGAADARGFRYYEHCHKHTDDAADIIYDFPLGFQNKLRNLSNCVGATQLNTNGKATVEE